MVVTVAEREVVDRGPRHVEVIGGQGSGPGRGWPRRARARRAHRVGSAAPAHVTSAAATWHELEGAVVAEELLDGVPYERRLTPERLELVRVPEGRGEAVAQQVGGGLAGTFRGLFPCFGSGFST